MLDFAKEEAMFELANPWFLLVLLLPLLYWYVMPQAKKRVQAGLKVPFFAAMQHIIGQQQHVMSRERSFFIPALIWLLLVIACAGPRWVGEPMPLSREGYNIMMALDLSGSMEIADMVMHGRAVNRLQVVKQAAAEFVAQRKGDKLGLILFGAQAYLQTPLTYDRHSVLLRIDDASVGLAGKTTSIGDAIGLAVKRLAQVPKEGRVLILLTDGANNSGVLAPLKAAQLAQQEGIKIYTIGLGAESDPRALAWGNAVNVNGADLDEETLERIAQITGGRYFRATDSHSLQTIYQTINQLERIKQEQATIRPQKDYYPWCAAIALILGLSWLMCSVTSWRLRIKLGGRR